MNDTTNFALRLSDANVSWVPKWRKGCYRGAVWISPYWDGEDRVPGELCSRANAGFGPQHAKEGDLPAQALSLFCLFHTLVIRDGINPKRLHEEFLSRLGVYREVISPDAPGAR
jgi:hypothetical protein